MFTERDWETYAECYDSLLSLTPYTELMRVAKAHTLKLNPRTVLDASCGTGNFPLTLYRDTDTHCRTVGIDRAGPMLERARRKCINLSQCSFLEADLNAPLPFSDEAFDLVVSINTLYAVHDPAFTLQEFHRVLAPHGHVLVVIPRHDFENGLILKQHCGSHKPDAYWHDVHASALREEQLIREAIADAAMAEAMLMVARHNRAIAHEQSFYFPTPEALQALIAEKGFVVQHCARVYAAQDTCIIAQKE